jgi:hypothetical protein
MEQFRVGVGGTFTMQRCPFCLADIPSEARKCRHCGEWVEGPTTADPDTLIDDRRRIRKSKHDYGGDAFLAGLLSFCLPPATIIAIGLAVAALIRLDRGDSIGWAIAGIILGEIALICWVIYTTWIVMLRFSRGY